MSGNEREYPRLQIEPQPAPDELLAILAAMYRTVAATPQPIPETSPVSHWQKTARREQMRHPLDEQRQGWNR